jgi:cell division transport system permease protein
MKNNFLNSFKRMLRLGWDNFYREKGISFVAVFVLTVVIIMATSFFIVGAITEDIINSVKEKADITIDFQLSASEEEILEVQEEIERAFEITSIKYTSKEEAKTAFIRTFGDRASVMESLEEVGNPFPSSLSIKADDPYIYQQVSDLLESNYPAIVDTVDFYHRQEVIEGIFSFTDNARKVGLVLVVIMGIISILLVYNTVKLAIYEMREEIRVMKLVGSSNAFIQGSFIVQGVLMGLSAAVLSFILLFPGGYLLVSPYDISIDVDINRYVFEMMPLIVIIHLGTGIVLGVLSSLIAANRYLK